MKASFLNSLIGMDIEDAETAVLSESHIPYTVPEECTAIASIARGNTVILWQMKGKVRIAEAGDPLELEKEPTVSEVFRSR